MKKCLLLLFVIFSLSAYSQISKSRATQYTYKSRTKSGWSSWSDWKNCNVLIVTDLDKMKFKIYSENIQEFDIIKFLEKKINKEGGETYEMFCVDKDGKQCRIRQKFLSEYNSDGFQLYVDYSNISYVYNAYFQ